MRLIVTALSAILLLYGCLDVFFAPPVDLSVHTSWVYLATIRSNISSYANVKASFSSTGSLYCVFSDTGSTYLVRGDTNYMFSQVSNGIIGSELSYMDLEIDNNEQVYLSGRNSGYLQVYKWNSNENLSTIPVPTVSGGRQSLALNSIDEPALVFSTNDYVYLCSFNGSDLTTIEHAYFHEDLMNGPLILMRPSDNEYLVFGLSWLSPRKIVLFQFAPGITNRYIEYLTVLDQAGAAYIASENRVTVLLDSDPFLSGGFSFDGSPHWEEHAEIGRGQPIYDLVLAQTGHTDELYAGFLDYIQSARIITYRYSGGAWSLYTSSKASPPGIENYDLLINPISHQLMMVCVVEENGVYNLNLYRAP